MRDDISFRKIISDLMNTVSNLPCKWKIALGCLAAVLALSPITLIFLWFDKPIQDPEVKVSRLFETSEITTTDICYTVKQTAAHKQSISISDQISGMISDFAGLSSYTDAVNLITESASLVQAVHSSKEEQVLIIPSGASCATLDELAIYQFTITYQTRLSHHPSYRGEFYLKQGQELIQLIIKGSKLSAEIETNTYRIITEE